MLGLLSSAFAVDVKIQVDLNSVTDYYPDGSVWIMMDNDWEVYYNMEDADADLIFEYTVVSAETDDIIYYKFSYQNGPDEWNDYVVETIPDECSADNGLRMFTVGNENETLPAFVYGSCFEAGITLRVDLSERDDVYESGSVWVVMDDNWEEYYDMMMFSEGVYFYTLEKDAGTILQYSFSYQNGPDPDNDYVWETVPAECANENGYRELLVPEGDTVLPAFLYGKCTEASGTKFTTTFQVDMRDPIIIDLYDGGGVWLNINDWTDYYDMTDDDGDNIYTFELEQDSGTTILYKYSYQYGPDPDADYMDEPVPDECSSPSSEWNREHTVTMDVTLPAVLMGSCGAFGDEGTEKFDVTFSVKLAGDSVSTNGMWMVSKNPWSWRQQMNTEGDIYSSSMKLYKDLTIPYTYVYGGKDNWDGEESLPEACNFGTETAPERLFEGTDKDTILPVAPFGGCIGDPDPVTVTYVVDMNGETLTEGDIVWAYIWPNDIWAVMADDDGDGVFTVNVNHVPGTEVQYFYAYGTEAIWDEETVPDPCSDSEGYRSFTVGEADHTLPSYIYGTCDVTGIPEFERQFAIYPNPVSENLYLEIIEINTVLNIKLSDVTGRTVYSSEEYGQKELAIPVGSLNNGIYILQIKSGKNSFSKKVLVNE